VTGGNGGQPCSNCGAPGKGPGECSDCKAAAKRLLEDLRKKREEDQD